MHTWLVKLTSGEEFLVDGEDLQHALVQAEKMVAEDEEIYEIEYYN